MRYFNGSRILGILRSIWYTLLFLVSISFRVLVFGILFLIIFNPLLVIGATFFYNTCLPCFYPSYRVTNPNFIPLISCSHVPHFPASLIPTFHTDVFGVHVHQGVYAPVHQVRINGGLVAGAYNSNIVVGGATLSFAYGIDNLLHDQSVIFAGLGLIIGFAHGIDNLFHRGTGTPPASGNGFNGGVNVSIGTGTPPASRNGSNGGADVSISTNSNRSSGGYASYDEESSSVHSSYDEENSSVYSSEREGSVVNAPLTIRPISYVDHEGETSYVPELPVRTPGQSDTNYERALAYWAESYVFHASPYIESYPVSDELATRRIQWWYANPNVQRFEDRTVVEYIARALFGIVNDNNPNIAQIRAACYEFIKLGLYTPPGGVWPAGRNLR